MAKVSWKAPKGKNRKRECIWGCNLFQNLSPTCWRSSLFPCSHNLGYATNGVAIPRNNDSKLGNEAKNTKKCCVLWNVEHLTHLREIMTKGKGQRNCSFALTFFLPYFVLLNQGASLLSIFVLCYHRRGQFLQLAWLPGNVGLEGLGPRPLQTFAKGKCSALINNFILRPRKRREASGCIKGSAVLFQGFTSTGQPSI